MESDIATLILGAAITGGVSSLATVAAIKVELRWLKRAAEKLETRIERVEKVVLQRAQP